MMDFRNDEKFSVIVWIEIEKWIALCGQPVDLIIHGDADATAAGLPPVSQWRLGVSDMLNLNAQSPSNAPTPSVTPVTLTPTSGWDISAEQAAEELFKLNLFRGTGVDQNGAPIFDFDL